MARGCVRAHGTTNTHICDGTINAEQHLLPPRTHLGPVTFFRTHCRDLSVHRYETIRFTSLYMDNLTYHVHVIYSVMFRVEIPAIF